MDWLLDTLRMKITSTMNRQNRRIPWNNVVLFLILSKHNVIYEEFKNKVFPYIKNKLITESNDKLAMENAKSIIKLTFDKENLLFKSILLKHKYDFDQITLDNEDDSFISKSKTIEIKEGIFLNLSFNKQEKDKEGKSIIKEKSKIEMKDSIGYIYSNALTIKELNDFINDTYQVKVVESSIKISNKSSRNLYNMKVYSLTGFDYKSDIAEVKVQDIKISKNINNVFLDPKIHNLIYNQIEKFENKSWYIDRGIPRTMGILMSGLPGCGKTSIIKALTSHTGRKVFIIDFKLVRTKEHLHEIFSCKFKVKDSIVKFNQDDVIYVFEDFDCMSDIFMNRDIKNQDNNDMMKAQQEMIKKLKIKLKKNKQKISVKEEKKDSSDEEEDYGRFKKSITLQNILEIFDGVIEMDGRMIIMTTNKRSSIDSALIRPGRIDLDLVLENPKRNLILYIFNFMYSNFSLEERMDILKKYGQYIKDQEVSTATVMNCFMYDDMKMGMEYLLSNYEYDIDSGYSESEFDSIKELELITNEFKIFNKNEHEQIINIMDEFDVNDLFLSSSTPSKLESQLIIFQKNDSFFQYLGLQYYYFSIKFPKKINIKKYYLHMLDYCFMTGWELIGVRDDNTEIILDKVIDVNSLIYDGTLDNNEYFQCIKIKVTEELKFFSIGNNFTLYNGFVMRYIELFGNVE